MLGTCFARPSFLFSPMVADSSYRPLLFRGGQVAESLKGDSMTRFLLSSLVLAFLTGILATGCGGGGKKADVPEASPPPLKEQPSAVQAS